MRECTSVCCMNEHVCVCVCVCECVRACVRACCLKSKTTLRKKTYCIDHAVFNGRLNVRSLISLSDVNSGSTLRDLIKSIFNSCSFPSQRFPFLVFKKSSLMMHARVSVHA